MLQKFLDVSPRQLTIDEFLAEIEAENRDGSPQMGATAAQIVATKDAGDGTDPHFCEVEAQCHELLGINGGQYICGFRIAGTVWGCPKRRRLNGGAKCTG